MTDFGPAAAAMLAAALAPLPGPVPAAGGAAPINLVTEATPAGLVVQVVGLSPTSAEASYALEMTGGSNRSTQRGSVRLRPNERVVLLTARLGGAAGRDWRALLTVTPSAGRPYKVERRGS